MSDFKALSSNYIFFVLLIAMGFRATVVGQAGIVIGITGNKLVQVNVENGGLTPLHTLENLPAGEELRNLVYVAKDEAFYSTLYTKTNPSLVRIRLTGQWEIVGEFKLNGTTPHFCEALTYNEQKDQLILAASMDGPVPRDKKSETLLIVDRNSANCSLAATIRQLPAPDDFDEIAVFGNMLFGFDGVPGRNTTYIYPFSLSHLDGRELFAGTKQNIPYFTMDDMVVVGHLLYFPHHRNQGWYIYDLRGRRFFELGKVHGPASLGRIKLTGLAYVPLSQA